jgi:hypothetical protein
MPKTLSGNRGLISFQSKTIPNIFLGNGVGAGSSPGWEGSQVPGAPLRPAIGRCVVV